jgi:F-box protein 11
MPRRGDFTTISESIQSAEPGTRILIRPGLYKEALVLDKALELIGDGERDEIVVETTDSDVLLFKTEFGRVSNLTLRQAGGGEFFAVDISQGRLELEDCDITSQSLACVAIYDDADPRLRRNRIHDGKQGGVFIYENGKGTLEDNDIWGNAFANVTIGEGGNPILRRNRIHDGKQVGVLVYDNGKGTLEDNEIWGNISNSGVVIRTGGTLTLRRNTITKHKYNAIWIYNNGGGIFENNDLRGNKRGPFKIDNSSKENVTMSGNIEE